MITKCDKCGEVHGIYFECTKGNNSARTPGCTAEIVDYHKQCHDCGQFVKQERWVRKDHPVKMWPLCAECFSNYDDPRDF